MEKYINEYGKECYSDITEETILKDMEFHNVKSEYGDNIQYALHTNLGSLTVLNRMTGYGFRDTETGYRDPEGKFWLASGDLDVRESGAKTIKDAIEWVKSYANTCVGEQT